MPKQDWNMIPTYFACQWMVAFSGNAGGLFWMQQGVYYPDIHYNGDIGLSLIGGDNGGAIPNRYLSLKGVYVASWVHFIFDTGPFNRNEPEYVPLYLATTNNLNRLSIGRFLPSVQSRR